MYRIIVKYSPIEMAHINPRTTPRESFPDVTSPPPPLRNRPWPPLTFVGELLFATAVAAASETAIKFPMNTIPTPIRPPHIASIVGTVRCSPIIKREKAEANKGELARSAKVVAAAVFFALMRGAGCLNSWGWGMDDVCMLPNLRRLTMVKGVAFPDGVAQYLNVPTQMTDYAPHAI